MKRLLGEYGKIIAVAAIGAVLITFLLSGGSGGMLGKLASIRPEIVSLVRNNPEILAAKNYTFSVETVRLSIGASHDFLDFVTEAVDEDGQGLNVRVKEILLPDGTVADTTTPTLTQAGVYEVTYHLENSNGVRAEKIYRFLAG